jgi:hypothetical protein
MPPIIIKILTSQVFITAMVALLIIGIIEIQAIKKVTKDALTGPDNETFDYSKASGLLGLICLNLGVLWHLYDDNVFAPVEYATAFSTILAASCGGVWLKAKGNDMPVVK